MRCAIYTRKSSMEGLDAEFTSLDNQREYCSAYIKSQAGEGWRELPELYNDGGFSGGNLKRPALAALRCEIAARRVDVVVVYKIDRLSRSLRDFANLVAEFEMSGVTFVSVTQSFNTATAMGRLTLNVLLSFAQFEREMTSERLRDFFLSSERRGHWINGKRPFGYQVVDKRLVIDEIEAEAVRWIFRHYCKVKSLRAVVAEAKRRGLKNRNNTEFTDTIIHKLLHNRVYRGERRRTAGQLHAPIIGEELWQRVKQILIEGQKGRRGRRKATPRHCLLKGKILDTDGRPCIPSGSARNGAYRYYLPNTYKARGRSQVGAVLKVEVVDSAVMAILNRHTGSSLDAPRSPTQDLRLINALVERVDIRDERVFVRLLAGATLCESIEGHIARPLPKRWEIVSPQGERLEFVNLSLWLRTNGHRFSASDVKPFPRSPGCCRAAIGLSTIRPGNGTRKTWKGWRWAPPET